MTLFLDPDRALMRGYPTKVVEAATGAGTSFSHAFSIIKNPMSDGKVKFQAIGTFTVFNGNLEVSSDGGTTWSLVQAFDFILTPFLETELGAGLVYRFNISNLTKTVSPNINAILS